MSLLNELESYRFVSATSMYFFHRKMSWDLHKTDKYYSINGLGGFRILRVKFQEFHGWKAKFLIKTVSLIRNNAGFDYQNLDILNYSSSKNAYIRKKMYFCSRKNGGYTPKKRIWLERSKEISILTG